MPALEAAQMNTLRVVHGLANNVMDFAVAEDFNLAMQVKCWQADGHINTGKFFVNWQWVQHAAVLTPEELANLTPAPGAPPSMKGTLQ
jgi:hypothetical protein